MRSLWLAILLLLAPLGVPALVIGTGTIKTMHQTSVETAEGWVKFPGNPVLGGDLGTCFDVCLLKEKGRFRMWFSWRPRKSLALVESRDGIHWSEPVIVLAPNPDTSWEADINRPVVLERAGLYQMWYTGQANGHSWIGRR